MSDSEIQKMLNQADGHLRGGRTLRARKLLEQILLRDPDCTTALFSMSVILYDGGELEAAVRYLKKYLEHCPEQAQVHFNLGTMLSQLGRTQDAIAALTQAVGLEPSLAPAHNNLGIIYRSLSDHQAARLCFENAVRHAPASLESILNLASTLMTLGEIGDALRQARRAVELDPSSGRSHFTVGLILERSGDAGSAMEHFRRAVALCPDVEEWKYHLAACEGQTVPASAPASYVTSLFDAYAERFDQHLVEKLEYRTPQYLLELVEQSSHPELMDILDLGCGTGLCGALFRPLARRLIGIDLSPAMIRMANERGIYDELHVEEIGEYLEAGRTPFDLVIASDVFVYVGDLWPIFKAAGDRLKSGGLLAFSVEACEGNRFKLSSERRYAHSLQYVRDTAEQAEFEEVATDQRVLRRNHGQDVSGWIVLLRRRAR